MLATRFILALARKHAPKAIETLAEIAEKGTPALAYPQPLPCLTAPMARHPRIFSTSDTQAFKRAIDMTDDEVVAIAARAKLTVV